MTTDPKSIAEHVGKVFIGALFVPFLIAAVPFLVAVWSVWMLYNASEMLGDLAVRSVRKHLEESKKR